MNEHEEFRVPPFNVETIDTTGAGDAFNAGFSAGYLKGWNLKRSADFERSSRAQDNEGGARNGLPRIGELEAFMQHEHN
jgi:ribokinase